MYRILRVEQVLDRYGKTRSPLYADMMAGTFVRPVKLGERAAGWPEHEVQQIIAARIAGADDSAIRALVTRLHDARKTALTAILNGADQPQPDVARAKRQAQSAGV